jgi:hypothetical protein
MTVPLNPVAPGNGGIPLRLHVERARPAVPEQRCYVVTRAFLICCVVALTGCVHALHPQNARSEQTLRIQASTAERHPVRVNDGQDYPVAPDGRVTFEVPPLLPIRWGRYMVTTLHGYMSYMGER